MEHFSSDRRAIRFLLLVVIFVAGSAFAVLLAETEQKLQRTESLALSRHTAITRAVELVSPAVVGINVTQVHRYVRKSPFAEDPFFRNFFPDIPFEKRVKSLGSGVIISREGYILTNQHVVENAAEIVVTMSGGNQFVAQKIGEDYKTDIAVLKIEGDRFPSARLGNSEEVIIGEWVIALGNPFGLFDIGSQPTVTVGVISAKDRDFGKLNNSRVYEDMLQTDAAINSGNSGGPLVNCLGEIIGINTWIISTDDYAGANIGLGFAIPVHRIKRILNDLINYGRVDRNFYTGITCNELTPLIALYLGLDNTNGCIIAEIARNSPAARADLEIGDVILSINGKDVANLNDIDRIIEELDLKKNDVILLRVYRNRRLIDIRLQLAAYPESMKGARP
ncbi:trypsin-like peptidase domain-containing protein [candidate division KSB1 bacterium]|nr:trypsin-like peptidase domain-containing protein [candidate division KSB1 bacterium]